MEDFRIDIMVGKGAGATSIPLDLAPFTLVGATTRSGLLPNPLRDRFGFTAHLEFYDDAELDEVLARAARMLGLDIPPDARAEIARRSRGTPRIANRLLRRVRDYALVHGTGAPTSTPSTRRSSSTTSTRSDSTASTARCWMRSSAASTAARSASTPSRSRSARSPRRSSRSSSRSSCGSGMLSRTPRGRVATPRGVGAPRAAPRVPSRAGRSSTMTYDSGAHTSQARRS